MSLVFRGPGDFPFQGSFRHFETQRGSSALKLLRGILGTPWGLNGRKCGSLPSFMKLLGGIGREECVVTCCVLRKWDAKSSGLSKVLKLIDFVKSFEFNCNLSPHLILHRILVNKHHCGHNNSKGAMTKLWGSVLDMDLCPPPGHFDAELFSIKQVEQLNHFYCAKWCGG